MNKKSYALAIKITELTKQFPREEKYVLVDQIRRSSRSIPANVVEAWAKRIYVKSFIAKIIDSYGEELDSEIRKMLIYMSRNPEKFCKNS